MPALQMIPACKDYAWGGHRCLREDYAIRSELDPLAEAWMLSARPESPSCIQGGDFGGMSFPDYLAKVGAKALGTLGQKFETFPMLIKLIDAKQGLPIQAHPSEAYAQAHGHASKAKLWVVLDAVPGAYLYCGLDQAVTQEELRTHIAGGTLPGILRKVPAKKGAAFFLPSGTLHALGEGMVVAEFQQDTDAPCYVFDGQGELPEEALEAVNLGPVEPMDFGVHLGQCPSFTVDRYVGTTDGVCGKDSFHILLVVEGGATLYCDGEHKTLNKGGCFFLPAGCGPYRLEGNCELLCASLS